MYLYFSVGFKGSVICCVQLLRAYSVDCPRYKALREEEAKSAEYKKIEEDNQVWSWFVYTCSAI